MNWQTMNTTKNKNFIFVLLIAMTFFGCAKKETTTTETSKEEVQEESTSVSTNLPDEAKKAAEEHLVKGKPAVFFFFANWCPACRVFKPTLEEVETKFPNVKVLRMDVDEQKDLTKSFKVTSIPTLFFFDKDGKFVESTTGGLATDVLTKQFEKINVAATETEATTSTEAPKEGDKAATDATKTTEVKKEEVKKEDASKATTSTTTSPAAKTETKKTEVKKETKTTTKKQ
ncbi:MAG: thioredoxin family protein [Candidatus Caenarcaniphilales bacterium]|nr:thioredoxin family protein [Candidatus Caenarcaniphilales bacterium]